MTLTEISPISVPLPEGYSMRPACLDDAEAVSKLRESVSLAMGNPDRVNPDDVRAGWAMPIFNLAESSRVIVSPEGQIVGSVTVMDIQDPPVNPNVQWQVHPEYVDRDLGVILLSWAEQRAMRAVDRCPADVRVALRSGTITGYTPREQAFAALNMVRIRDSYRMLIEMAETPPPAQLPTGISICTYKHPDDLDQTLHALEESFRDHWGYVEQPFDHVRDYWQHRIKDDRLFDETLWFLAIDDETGAIAGTSLCRREDREDPDAGHVDELGVRPAYRKRGLGLALLHHTFGEFWKRGQSRVSLIVDASSLTGAVRLYERSGMHVDRQWAIYEKELRPGVDISTTHVE